jgi:DNA-3-methyladenine glycosylase
MTKVHTTKDGLRDAPFARLKPLSPGFYARDPRRVARALLGKLLLRRRGRQLLAGRIVEVEAYLGENDLAAHAAAGRTARNQVLFGPPGHAYVYFIYGNHYCLNVSCEREGKAGCVLIRALEPVAGTETMARLRDLEPLGCAAPGTKALRALTSGPGRLCEALDITRERDNGKALTDPRSRLWIAEDGTPPPRVTSTPRIGITKSAQDRLRYIVAGSGFVSGPRRMNQEGHGGSRRKAEGRRGK